jgi:hypothetical protein
MGNYSVLEVTYTKLKWMALWDAKMQGLPHLHCETLSMSRQSAKALKLKPYRAFHWALPWPNGPAWNWCYGPSYPSQQTLSLSMVFEPLLGPSAALNIVKSIHLKNYYSPGRFSQKLWVAPTDWLHLKISESEWLKVRDSEDTYLHRSGALHGLDA